LIKNSLETTDIFRGAFFLCRGGELSGIRFRENGKRTACFLFTGRGLDRLDKQYRDGQALVNPLQFRESLNHLRDILFNKLREDGPATSRLPLAEVARQLGVTTSAVSRMITRADN
jgi:hypothetical protein